MVDLSRRKIASVMLLSIVIPVSLLATLRIIGIVPEPATPEIVTLQTAYWKMERPSETIFNHDIWNIYSDDFINVSVLIVRYAEDSVTYDGYDVVEILVYLRGCLSSTVAKFQPTDAHSILGIDTEYVQNPPRNPKAAVNITVTDLQPAGTNATEAYVGARATDPSSSLTVFAYWVFYDSVENNKDHKLSMTFEATYSNATAYRKIVAPAVFEVPLARG